AAEAVDPEQRRAAGFWAGSRRQGAEAARAGDAPRALALARQALALARDNLGPDHRATLISLGDLAAAERAAGNVAGADGLYREAIARSGAVLGPGHPDTLALYPPLAALLREQLRLGEAAALLEQGAAAAAQALGPTHPQTLSLAFALAGARLDLGRPALARDGLAPLCEAIAADYGAAHEQYAHCLSLEARTRRQQGAFAAAAALLDRARAIEALALPADAPAALATRLEAGEVARRLAQTDAARALFEGVAKAGQGAAEGLALSARADLAELDAAAGEAGAEAEARAVLAARIARDGADAPDSLAARSTLAQVLRQLGRLTEAEAEFARVWQGYRDRLGEGHPATLVAADNLGELLEQEGLYDRAEPVLRAGLDGARAVFGALHPTTLTALNNLALLHEGQGLFDKAEPLERAAASGFAETLGPAHPDSLAALNNLAYLLMLKGAPAEAAPLFDRVHQGWAQTLGPQARDTLKALNNRGRARLAQGDVAAAEPLLRAALTLRRASLGERHPDTLRSMHDLAAARRAAGKPAEAAALLRQTLAGDEAVLGPLHPYTFETLASLAGAEEALGALEAAHATRRLAFQRRTAFLDRMLPVTGEAAREGYLRLQAPEYSAYVALLTRLDPAEGGRELAEVGLARKGLLLQVASETAQIARLARDPALDRIAAALAAARKDLAARTLAGPAPDQDAAAHAAALAAIAERISALQGELGRASQRLRRTIAPATLDELVAALPDQAALVDYVAYTDPAGGRALAAAVLRKEASGPVFTLVRLGDAAAIDRAVARYRAAIQDEEAELDDQLDAGQAVARLVWTPLAAALGGRGRVYLVPDGQLNLLPFAALVGEDRHYLVERVDLRLLTSSRDLLMRPLPLATGPVVIDAGPDYNAATQPAPEAAAEAAAAGRAARPVEAGLRGAAGLRGLHFDPLPGAAREGAVIERTVEAEGRPTRVRSGAEAEEASLRGLDSPPELLHIATHGFFLKPDDGLRQRLLKAQRSGEFEPPPPGDDPLLRSGLAFAGINANARRLGEIDTDNDGVLTALEVLGLDLSGTRLAILSACETGLGEVHEGEGVYGLRRAFQEAGAQAVVSSLWQVSDAGTQTLMAALYKRLLAGQPPAEALRAAQLEMLRTPEWSAPYVWSAFMMVGG
ncbi:CHAT domain-containing tetratricopeptide repeat protein, partial [Phaeospirillum tilakii]